MATIPYTFKNVNVSYAGITLSDFGQGDDVVTIALNNPLTSTLVGADGGAAVNLHADKSAKASMKMLATSYSNNVLAGFYELIAGGITVGILNPLVIRDSSGAALFVGDAILEGFPSDTAFGNDAGSWTWVFNIPEVGAFPGALGNPLI